MRIINTTDTIDDKTLVYKSLFPSSTILQHRFVLLVIKNTTAFSLLEPHHTFLDLTQLPSPEIEMHYESDVILLTNSLLSCSIRNSRSRRLL